MDELEEAGWSWDDVTAAESEGWAIFECDDSEEGPYQIQKFNEPENWLRAPSPYPFENDEDVWKFIMSTPSALHTHAMDVLLKVNPQEYNTIKEWTSQ